MSTADSTRAVSDGYAAKDTRDYAGDTSGDGWVAFAGIMLVMVGTLNVIDGIAAISNSTFFTENARYVISDLNTFGWIVLILGSVQVLAAFGIWAKTAGVRWFGVTVAGLNGIAQLLFIPAYPFWSTDAVHRRHRGDLRADRPRQALADVIRLGAAADDRPSPAACSSPLIECGRDPLARGGPVHRRTLSAPAGQRQ